MFRFIGGPARCGKSTLAGQAELLHTGQVISLDNFRAGLLPLVSKETHEILSVRPNHTEHTFDEWIKILKTRDDLAWQAIKGYLSGATNNNDDVLMEGGVWPDQVSELDVPYRAVFLVDTSPDHADRLLAAARDSATHNNWHSERSDEWIYGWAKYNNLRSQVFKDLAVQHDQAVFDIADGGIRQAQAAALAHLFQSGSRFN